jgi:transcriptional regulator with XRE-family HTH domain
MARVGLPCTVHQLAEKASVMPNTVSNFEKERGVQMSTAKALEHALLSTGRIRFDGNTCVCVDD